MTKWTKCGVQECKNSEAIEIVGECAEAHMESTKLTGKQCPQTVYTAKRFPKKLTGKQCPQKVYTAKGFHFEKTM